MPKFFQVNAHTGNQTMVKNIDHVFLDNIVDRFEVGDQVHFIFQYEEDNELFEKAALVGARNMAEQMMSTHN